MHGWQVNIATKPDALEILAQCQLADKKWQVRVCAMSGQLSRSSWHCLLLIFYFVSVSCRCRILWTTRDRVSRDFTACTYLRRRCLILCFVMFQTRHAHSQEDEDDASIAAANRFLSPMEVDLARKALAAVQVRVCSGMRGGNATPTNR